MPGDLIESSQAHNAPHEMDCGLQGAGRWWPGSLHCTGARAMVLRGSQLGSGEPRPGTAASDP